MKSTKTTKSMEEYVSNNLAQCLVITAILSTIVGCSPVGENVVKKQSLGNEPSFVLQEDGIDASSLSIESLLDEDTERIITSYGSTIKENSATYGFDWRLILAVMKQESQFDPKAKSHRGASGFMQMMPRTRAEIARKLNLKDITQPKNNIRGGIYYMSRLYRLFEGAEESDRIKLTLAAYNAGIRRIYDAQEVAAYFHEDPTRWRSIQDALPLLSKRYYTLHGNVWPEKKPRSGWFGNSTETVAYVENILTYYDEYRLMLN